MSYVNTRFNMLLILSHSCCCFDTIISFSVRLTQKVVLNEGGDIICFHEVRFSILCGINFFRFFRNPWNSPSRNSQNRSLQELLLSPWSVGGVTMWRAEALDKNFSKDFK